MRRFLNHEVFEYVKASYDVRGLTGDIIVIRDSDGSIENIIIKNTRQAPNFSFEEKYRDYCNDNDIDFVPKQSFDELSQKEQRKMLEWEIDN